MAEELQAIFPNASSETLEAVLALSGGDVNVATNYLLEGGDIQEVEAAVHEADQADNDDDEDGEAPEDDDDDDDEEEEAQPPAPAAFGLDSDGAARKRLRTVEPTPAAQHAGGKTNLVRFDERLLRKTYLELINLLPSQLSHKSITVWSDELHDHAAALAMLEGEGEGGGESSSTHRGGWWVQYFPADEADHVWRLLVNAHVKSNLFGSVMHFTGPGFGRRPGAEVEARVLVRDRAELAEMRRVGAGLMAASPTHAQRDFMLFHSGPLPKGAIGKEARCKLEEQSQFKMHKTRASELASSASRSKPLAAIDPARVVYQLFQVERGNPTKWAPVDTSQ